MLPYPYLIHLFYDLLRMGPDAQLNAHLQTLFVDVRAILAERLGMTPERVQAMFEARLALHQQHLAVLL